MGRPYPMKASEQKRTVNWWSTLAALCITGGIVILLTSLLWPNKSTSHSNWSLEQAKQYQAASVKLHSLSHASLHADPGTDPQTARKELQQAEDDYQAIRSQLDS